MQIVAAHLSHVGGLAARSRTAVKDLVSNPRMCDMRRKHRALALNEHAVFVETLSILKPVKASGDLNTVRNKASLYCRDAFLLKLLDECILIDLVSVESYCDMSRLKHCLADLVSSLLAEILLEYAVDLRL